MEKKSSTGSLPNCLQEEIDAVLQPALMKGLVEIDGNGEYQITDAKAKITVPPDAPVPNNEVTPDKINQSITRLIFGGFIEKVPDGSRTKK